MLSGIAFMAIATASFANDVEETKTDKQGYINELVVFTELDDIRGRCTGDAVVQNSRGQLIFVEMEAVITENDLDCNRLFGEFLSELHAGYVQVLTFRNHYNESY